MIGCLKTSPSDLAIARDAMSPGEPGPSGWIILIVREGYACVGSSAEALKLNVNPRSETTNISAEIDKRIAALPRSGVRPKSVAGSTAERAHELIDGKNTRRTLSHATKSFF
jgi:hypothetical protein